MNAVPEHHSLFVYDDDDEFVDRMTAFLGGGAEDGEAALAVAAQRKCELLRDGLGDMSDRVGFIDTAAVYSRPETVIAEYDAVLRRLVAVGAPVVRLLGELPVWQAREEQDAWVVYEALLNRAFAQHPVSIVCGYDLREQPAPVVEGAWCTHPTVLSDVWEDNPRYRDPADVVRRLTPRPPLLPDLREVPVHGDPRDLGDGLRRDLAALQVPSGRADGLLVAAARVFDNAQTHGRGVRSERLGRVGERVVWELSDDGPGFDDPLAGYLPPQADHRGDPGLWVARQHTHRVEFLQSPHGFTTRLWA